MPKCPNCGQVTARTEDWACQWCGYPLLSNSFKKIAKTYRQLKEETHPVPGPLSTAGAKPRAVFEPGSQFESAPGPETVAQRVAEPEPVPQLESEPTPEAEAEPEPETVSGQGSQSGTALERATEPAPVPIAEPVLEPGPPTAAMELTVEDLLVAYETEGVAADARFNGKILKVTGLVNRIEVKDALSIYYIILHSAEESRRQGARCTFDRKYGPELNRLAVGQTVTVQGKYDGSIIEISLRDCVLAR